MWCPEATALEEMALDVLPAEQRTALVAHLEDCRSCRRYLRGLAEAADQLLLAVPPADPPPGFVAAVLAHWRRTSPSAAPAVSGCQSLPVGRS
jgi:predicted anti-sigma-YlaC factor YlaD